MAKEHNTLQNSYSIKARIALRPKGENFSTKLYYLVHIEVFWDQKYEQGIQNTKIQGTSGRGNTES